jgi:membrane-associated phospholipid phosphatase
VPITQTFRIQTKSSSRLLLAGTIFLIAYVCIFALILSGVFQSEDAWLAIRINSASVAWATPLMIFATNYGREYFWTALVALMLIFGKRETKMLAIELAVLFIVGIFVGDALKIAYYRERPFLALPTGQINLLVQTDSDSSFPSGHALIVSIGAFFAFSRLGTRGGKSWRLLSAVLILEAAIVCYSRVYLGAHYPTDVLGGIFVGGAIVYLGLYLIEGHFGALLSNFGGYIEKAFRRIGMHGMI